MAFDSATTVAGAKPRSTWVQVSEQIPAAAHVTAPQPGRTLSLVMQHPSYGAALRQERGALEAFLDQHWRVSVKDDARPEAFVAAVRDGLAAQGWSPERLGVLVGSEKKSGLTALLDVALAVGVMQGEQWGLSDARSAPDSSRGLQREERWALQDALRTLSSTSRMLDFETFADVVSRAAKKHLGVKAAPKGYAAFKKTAEEYDLSGPEADDYRGRRLHSRVGAGCPGAGEELSRQGVFYNDLRDRSPVETLIGVSLRQGISFGLEGAERSLAEAIERAGLPVGADSFVP